ncbi:hypothetical protein GCM10022380_39790 [Amycolatopsis tucumanensis]|uniref:Uncharacterized protein n=1 Tax=Amycolatopsis tucumanensis TaxID=401106 RepID=A0ABP7IFU2_9PSEU
MMLAWTSQNTTADTIASSATTPEVRRDEQRPDGDVRRGIACAGSALTMQLTPDEG